MRPFQYSSLLTENVYLMSQLSVRGRPKFFHVGYCASTRGFLGSSHIGHRFGTTFFQYCGWANKANEAYGNLKITIYRKDGIDMWTFHSKSSFDKKNRKYVHIPNLIGMTMSDWRGGWIHELDTLLLMDTEHANIAFGIFLCHPAFRFGQVGLPNRKYSTFRGYSTNI